MKKWFVLSVCLALALLCGAAFAEADPYVDIFPRNSMAVGGSLDFAFDDFDSTRDQYVHILREEADGTYTSVAVIKAWDAASGTKVEKIEAGTVTEPGAYWLTLGTDPDYAGIDGNLVVSLSFRALETQLAAPVIQNVVTGGAVGTDLSFNVETSEGTAMVYFELNLIKNGEAIPVYWDTFGTYFDVLGLYTAEPGTYQIRVSAHPQEFGGPVSEEYADSDTAVYEFTLADGIIPECPAPVISMTEADYDPDRTFEIFYTVPGAEAVTCGYAVVNPVDREFDAGTGYLYTCTAGDTGSMYADIGPGIYHLFCFGRYNGVWSSQGEAVFTLNPAGYLDVPAVSWQGNRVEDTLQVSGTDPLVFSVACENAETVSCETLRKASSGEFEWLDWIDCPVNDDGTVVVDLSGLNLTDGTYSLRFIPSRDGWLGQGNATVQLIISSQP